MVTRLCVSDSGDAWRNLGVEEYLLDSVGPDDAVIYLYVNDRSVIIGRCQNPWAECRLSRMAADGVQLARRISGGGAVYHDRGNLNYSFIMGKNRYDLDAQMSLILGAVNALGIEAGFSGRNDLLADGRKFSGNAFCARGDARLHHGTLLVNAALDRLQEYLNVDARKLNAKGVKSVRSRVCNLGELAAGLDVDNVKGALLRACRRAYGDLEGLSDADMDATALAPYLEKQASEAWRLGETPRFDFEINHRFEWGGVQLLLRLRGGRIEALDVYTDANDAELARRVRERLAGVLFAPHEMSRAVLACETPQTDDLAVLLANLPI